MRSNIILIGVTVMVLIMPEFLSLSIATADPNKIWVPVHRTSNGVLIPGHWRPANKPGFDWIKGKEVNGTWVTGYWKPIGPPPAGKIWAKGYWKNGRWHPGYWTVKKKGIWIPGHYGRRGRWIPGHYK